MDISVPSEVLFVKMARFDGDYTLSNCVGGGQWKNIFPAAYFVLTNLSEVKSEKP